MKPNPLSPEVRSFAEANQLNIHEASELMEAQSTPPEKQHAWLREEAIAKQNAKQASDEADQAITAKLRAFDQYQAAISDADQIRKDIAAGEYLATSAANLIQKSQEAFDTWSKFNREGKWHLVHNTLLEIAAARELVKLMPASLKKMRAHLAEVEASITAAEDNYGFTKE